MSFKKVNYIDGETVITAKNLNDIQNELTDLKQQIGERYSKPSGGIPESDLSESVQQKLNEGGGSGVTAEMADTLWRLLNKAAYATAPTEAEINAFSAAWGVVPHPDPDPDPEPPVESVTITYEDGVATVHGLRSVDITYSGTTATVGG